MPKKGQRYTYLNFEGVLGIDKKWDNA